MSGRIRTVKPEWLEDEELHRAGVDARVLSIALVLLADDYGRGRCVFEVLAYQVFGLESEPLAKFREAFARLSDMEFVRGYEVRGQSYFEIRNWSKHQRVDKPGKPHVPAPLPDSKTFRECSRESREALAPDLRPPTSDLDPDHDPDHDPVSVVVASLPPRRRQHPVADLVPASTPAWESYSAAYLARYGRQPLRNAKVNAQLKQFCQRIPAEDWAATIEHYLRSNNSWYVQKGHLTGPLLDDAEKLHTEALTGRHGTATGARRVDKQADRVGQYQELFDELADEEAADAARLNGGAA